MPYIYATALPRDIVKVGRASKPGRALAAQMYYPERIEVLAMWDTAHPVKDEARALAACARWRVSGELFKVPTDWLDIEHPLVTHLRTILGAPLPRSTRRGITGYVYPAGNYSRAKGRPVKGIKPDDNG